MKTLDIFSPALLVIGYGNTLRGDDGVGPRIAEAVGRWNWPGVHSLVCQQLSPELADPVSRAKVVVFVDASVEAARDVQWRPLAPGESSQLMAHAADPRLLLALSRDVFGRCPEAWWLTVPAVNMGFSEEFSAETRAGLHDAFEQVRALAEKICRVHGKKYKAPANAR